MCTYKLACLSFWSQQWAIVCSYSWLHARWSVWSVIIYFLLFRAAPVNSLLCPLSTSSVVQTTKHCFTCCSLARPRIIYCCLTQWHLGCLRLRYLLMRWMWMLAWKYVAGGDRDSIHGTVKEFFLCPRKAIELSIKNRDLWAELRTQIFCMRQRYVIIALSRCSIIQNITAFTVPILNRYGPTHTAHTLW
jgi:hypothetical protein